LKVISTASALEFKLVYAGEAQVTLKTLDPCLLYMSTRLGVAPFRGEAKINEVERHFFEYVSMSTVAHFWNLLSVTDENIVELQIVVDKSTVMN
jgi:hypothetical protein